MPSTSCSSTPSWSARCSRTSWRQSTRRASSTATTRASYIALSRTQTPSLPIAPNVWRRTATRSCCARSATATRSSTTRSEYITQRSRGVKTLDDLGVSIRRKKRIERFAQQTDMEILLEERRLAQIEAGTYEPTEDELKRPVHVGMPKGAYYKPRYTAMKNTFRLDMSATEGSADARENQRLARSAAHGGLRQGQVPR